MSNRKPDQLDDAEFNQLVYDISKPTFNYLIKRVTKEILESKEFKSMDANQFYNILVASMAGINTNLLRWIQNFHKMKTDSDINFTALQHALYHHVNEQLKVVIQ